MEKIGFPLKAGQRWSRKPIQMKSDGGACYYSLHVKKTPRPKHNTQHACHALLRQIEGKGKQSVRALGNRIHRFKSSVSRLWRAQVSRNLHPGQGAIVQRTGPCVVSQLQVWDTQQNSGLLIYLLLAIGQVEIVADRGINSKVDGLETWDYICQQMEKAFSQSNFEGGVVSGIQAVTQQLVKHFPANEHSRNELPNKPVVLWRTDLQRFVWYGAFRLIGVVALEHNSSIAFVKCLHDIRMVWSPEIRT